MLALMNAPHKPQEPELDLDTLGQLHMKQMSALERTRAALATALLAAREQGGRDATWHRLAVRSGYAGASSVRKVVEEAKAKARQRDHDDA